MDSDGSLMPIDATTASKPSLNKTWFLALLKNMWNRRKRVDVQDEQIDETVGTTSAGTESDNMSELSGDPETTAVDKRARVTNGTMVAGRRRKRAKKRM